jgi:hypothetical protein
MKVNSFVESRQDEVIRKILEHCGLWHDPPPRAPPLATLKPVPLVAETDSAHRVEMDGEYLEHLHRASMSDQLELPWE